MVERKKYLMEKIANRIDKWYYSGGDIGNIWVDKNGKKYHHIQNIIEAYNKTKKQDEFIINWERGEIYVK
jgi:hypothetical protein